MSVEQYWIYPVIVDEIGEVLAQLPHPDTWTADYITVDANGDVRQTMVAPDPDAVWWHHGSETVLASVDIPIGVDWRRCCWSREEVKQWKEAQGGS